MGTRTEPGRFDCHGRAEPDEPLFTLLARDPLAPFLVSIWSSLRYGDFEAAGVKFRATLDRVAGLYQAEPDVEKASEALTCAMAMFAWYREHQPDGIDAPEPGPRPPVDRLAEYLNGAFDLPKEAGR